MHTLPNGNERYDGMKAIEIELKVKHSVEIMDFGLFGCFFFICLLVSHQTPPSSPRIRRTFINSKNSRKKKHFKGAEIKNPQQNIWN